MIIFLTYSFKSSLSMLNEAFHFTNSGLKLLKKNDSEIHKRNFKKILSFILKKNENMKYKVFLEKLRFNLFSLCSSNMIYQIPFSLSYTVFTFYRYLCQILYSVRFKRNVD